MADVLKIALLILGTQVVLVCYWLMAEALFPAVVTRCRERYEGSPVRVTLVGLAVAVPVLLVSVVLGKVAHPAAKLVGLTLGLTPLLLGMIGSAGLSQRVGLGLPSVLDSDQPWRRVLRGGVVLVFVFLLPVLGWFFILPWALVSGLGAWVLSLARRERSAVAGPPALGSPQAAA